MRWFDLAHPYHEGAGGPPCRILIAENLANLTAIAGRRLTIGAFPLKIKGGDGAPARIFALEP